MNDPLFISLGNPLFVALVVASVLAISIVLAIALEKWLYRTCLREIERQIARDGLCTRSRSRSSASGPGGNRDEP